MAGKKKPSIEDSLKIFKDILKRTSGKEVTDMKFEYLNRNVITSIEIKGKSYLLIMSVDEILWNLIMQDSELSLDELDITKDNNIISIINMYTSIPNDSWIQLDNELLYNGGIIKIRPKDYEYDIVINKNLLPVKMKKSEFNNLSYSMHQSISSYFIISKAFVFDEIDGCNFNISRIFKIM